MEVCGHFFHIDFIFKMAFSIYAIQLMDVWKTFYVKVHQNANGLSLLGNIPIRMCYKHIASLFEILAEIYSISSVPQAFPGTLHNDAM